MTWRGAVRIWRPWWSHVFFALKPWLIP
jgi:hypothetical protein